MGVLQDWGKKSSNYWETRVDKPFRKATGHDETDLREKEAESRQVAQEQQDKTSGVLAGMKESDNRYLGDMKNYGEGHIKATRDTGNSYIGDMERLKSQTESQAKDAQTTYSNDIQPNQKKLMEDAMKNAGQAMSLEDAMNPNNKVASGVRDLYNQEGQRIRQGGLNDAGVLAALGAQATAGQMGGMPVFTGSNLQTISSQNQRQSGEAFAAAQKRMMDLREQGLGKGIEQSNAMYDRGQMAQDSAGRRVGEYQEGGLRNDDNQRAFRGESAGYSGDIANTRSHINNTEYDINTGNAGIAHGLSMGQGQRDMGIFNQDAGNQQAGIANEMGRLQNSGFRGSKQMIPAIIGAVAGGGGGGGGSSAPVGNQNPQQVNSPAYGAGAGGGGQNYGGNPYSLNGQPGGVTGGMNQDDPYRYNRGR